MGEEIVKNVAAVDYVFSGGALKSLPAFLDACLSGDTDARERIQGVFSKTNCRTLLSPVAGTIGEELPLDVPVPLDYGAFLRSFESRFPGEGMGPILLFETSRGCWWGQKAHCTFCGLNGQSMSYRAMSPYLARQVIQSLFKYAPRVKRLQCVDNIMPKHYPREVFADLGTPPEMTIFYEVKADLTDEDLRLLSAARVREVQPGIESLATSTLKLMKKGTTVFQNLRFLSGCLAHNIFPCWSLLIGFPGERSDVYEKYVTDIPKLVHLPPPSGVYPVRPDRYSPYQVRAKEFGLDLHPADFYDLVYPFPPQILRNLAYFFRDHNFAADHFVAMVNWFNRVREEVELWRRRWDLAIHTQPPLLYLKACAGGAVVVVDSRSGDVIEHPISSAGQLLLRHLARARKSAELASDLASDGELATELATLLDLELLFQEGDHIVSLVLTEKPSWNETGNGWSWAA
jgi:magnesium-protoporphyrin IX monomethyl ester (oxidative) cyclase